MESNLVVLALVLAVVWYLGSAINAVLAGSGELAAKEFTAFSQEQDLRLRKGRVKRFKAVAKVVDQEVYSDKEWDILFGNNIDKHEDTEESDKK